MVPWTDVRPAPESRDAFTYLSRGESYDRYPFEVVVDDLQHEVTVFLCMPNFYCLGSSISIYVAHTSGCS